MKPTDNAKGGPLSETAPRKTLAREFDDLGSVKVGDLEESAALPQRYCMRKGHHRPADGVPVTRAYPSTKWGNRAADWKKVGRAEAVRAFRHWLFETEVGRARLAEARLELRGRPLGCYCPPGEPCHGDVLVEAVNTR